MRAKRYDYRAAFEKIGFTMIGLWLALALNNWNDGLKKRQDEKSMLLQLETALEQDIRDIEETISGYQYRVDGSKVVLKNLHAESVVTDSLKAALQSLNGYSFLSANKGAYETLKSRGLDLISNDSLRLRIASLYEVNYLITERSEAFFQKIFSDQVVPYLYNNMRWTPGGLLPIDWAKTRNDNYFEQLVNGVYYNNENILRLYKDLRSTVKALSEDIQVELGRR